jgi:hypothetical protein
MLGPRGLEHGRQARGHGGLNGQLLHCVALSRDQNQIFKPDFQRSTYDKLPI